MKRFIRVVMWSTCIFFIFIPLLIIFLILEREPLVFDTQTVRTDDAVRTGRFARQMVKKLLENSDRAHIVSASEKDLNALFAVGHRSIPEASAISTISSELFEVEATLKVPPNPVGNYLNFRLNLLPSESGFRVARATIGDLFLTDSMVRFIAGLGLNLVFGDNAGEQLLQSVHAVDLKKGQIDVYLKPISNMPQLVQQMKRRVRRIRDEVALLGRPEHIRLYYSALSKLGQDLPENQRVSLSYFMGHLFQMAVNRGGDPVLENRAAILALGIYLGNWRVEQMTGRVRTEKMKQAARQDLEVVLAGREDLRLHFLISAVLQMASESGITHAIGEFKELLDAGDGGSGFSFVDLAADRAGVRFAEAATNPEVAHVLQQRLALDASESQFFPVIQNLPEGLSEASFEHHFGTLESERYLHLVNSVDACLDQLPVYSSGKFLSGAAGCDMSYVVPEALMS